MIQRSFSIEHLYKLDFKQVLEDLGIEIVVQTNDEIQCHCPFPENHEGGVDNNPSFGFNIDKMKYNCFVCGGSDVIDLVERLTGLDEDEALKYLEAYLTGENVTVEDLTERIKRNIAGIKETPMPSYPKDLLFKYDKGIHPYIMRRGISEEVAIELQVGWDDDHCGIMIPHFWQGKLVGWQVRHLAEDPNRPNRFICPTCFKDSKYGDKYAKKGVPKYKNSSTFPKVNTLYNYDGAIQPALQGEPLIVVESPMSTLYLKTYGFTSMATFGSFSNEQMFSLIAVPNVYLWPDHDKAGEVNIKRVVDFLKQYTNVWIVPMVPGDKSDAADVPPDQLQSYIDAAYRPFDLQRNGLITYEEIS
jgi:DNA primase